MSSFSPGSSLWLEEPPQKVARPSRGTLRLTGIHETFRAHARKYPDALAVWDEGRQVCYQELERSSNRLSRHLQNLGVGPEVPVGLYFAGSVDFVTAALAVLKAGGAYIPLDSRCPVALTHSILKDASAGVLLSHGSLAANVPDGGWKRVDLDCDRDVLAQYSAEPLNTRVRDEQLAYISYRPDSAGQPRAFEMSHSSLCRLVQWYHRAFSLNSSDRVGQIAGLAFYEAAWQIWCPLTAGASLHLIGPENCTSPRELKEHLLAKKITVASTPTLMAESLISLKWLKDVPLRLLLTSTEPLHGYPKRKLPFTLISNYSPAEFPILVGSSRILPADDLLQTPTIGRPIDSTEVLLLDDNGGPVALGEVGEICVSSPHIGRGSRNISVLKTTGGIMPIYRTGERGRSLPGGQIVFLGAVVDRIEVQGSLVDGNEVVMQLNAHGQICSSAVIATAQQGEDPHLVAYVVLGLRRSVSASELKAFLRTRLPGHMIPSIYVRLLSLPLTPHGRLDKSALPRPTVANRLPEFSRLSAPQSPQTDTEVRVARLVSGLMHGVKLRPTENLFTAGGYSTLAAQLLARIREVFQVDLSLRQLFDSPSIVALSALVESKLPVKSDNSQDHSLQKPNHPAR